MKAKIIGTILSASISLGLTGCDQMAVAAKIQNEFSEEMISSNKTTDSESTDLFTEEELLPSNPLPLDQTIGSIQDISGYLPTSYVQETLGETYGDSPHSISVTKITDGKDFKTVYHFPGADTCPDGEYSIESISFLYKEGIFYYDASFFFGKTKHHESYMQNSLEHEFTDSIASFIDSFHGYSSEDSLFEHTIYAGQTDQYLIYQLDNAGTYLAYIDINTQLLAKLEYTSYDNSGSILYKQNDLFTQVDTSLLYPDSDSYQDFDERVNDGVIDDPDLINYMFTDFL